MGRALWRALQTSAPARRSYFGGAVVSRLTMDWNPGQASADRTIRADLTTLRERSRELVRSSGFASGFLGMLEDNVVGDAGVQLQCRIRTDKGEFNRPLNSLIERQWRTWAHRETASIDGLLSLAELERLVLCGTAQDGESLVRLITGAENPYGFALQVLDPDLLDPTYNLPAGANQRQVRMAIERDRWGRPLVYHLWTSHPNDIEGLPLARERQPVPAPDLVHLFLSRRAGQSRGVPWFAPILLNAQMLRGYTEAELTASRVAAAKMGFLESTDEGSVTPIAGAEEQPHTMDAAPGLIDELPPGLKFSSWDPQHPNAAFSDFTKTILREYAAGLGTSYMSLGNDLEATSFSSGRIGLLAERDTWRKLQGWLIERFHRPVFVAWCRAARLSGQLPAESRLAEAEGAVFFKGRRWPWVDPGKDVAASNDAIDNGLSSRTKVLAEQGLDVEEIFADLDREQQLAQEYGLTLGARPAGNAPADEPVDQAPGRATPRLALRGIR